MDKTVKFWDVHQSNTSDSFEQMTNSNNNLSLNSLNWSRNSSGGSSLISSELIRTACVDFQVYDIDVDVQNVFYFTGAIKQPLRQLTKAPPPPPPTNFVINKVNSANANANDNANISQLNTSTCTINSSMLKTSLEKNPASKSKVRQKVTSRKSSAPQLTTQSNADNSFNTNTNVNSSSTVNTRRRQALVANSNTISQPPLSAPPPPPPLNSSFLNDDDLYEV